MLEAVWIGFAFSMGLVVRMVGLPPLVGYLAAGFVIASLSSELGLPTESGEILQHVSHLGVLLLLFTVGLKLNVRNLVKPEVIGGGLLHFVFSCVLFAPAFYLLLDVSAYEAAMLAIALA
ncbi:MAG: cation:proton antiporter, partial [Pseudohongiellaceae bacterium]